ncbi:hypothetical protein ACQ859_09380 [Roseateles chitinivorans]|uniref:hypothetical protein n=1 Tax=Roseateles chitinivorans TaxID=2917965 RepID=UPI003D66C0B5
MLLLHVALIAWLQHAWHRAEAHREQRSSTVRMVTIQLPPPSKPAPTKTLTTKTMTAARSPERRANPDPKVPPPDGAPSTRPSARVQSPRPDVDRHEEEPRSTVVIAAPAPASSSASGPSGRDLMYGAATQRAVRQGTQGQPLLAERADNASLAPDRIDASTKLGNEMMKGATGDCLKGEFAGAGAGLLSLPFWALAEARGKCRR